MSHNQFEAMFKAYRRTLGSAYPKQDVLAVLAVFDHCLAAPTTSQDQICVATGLNPGNVNKIITRACKEEWIHRDSGRTSEGKKHLDLTEKGRSVLAELDTLCANAIEVIPVSRAALDQVRSPAASRRSPGSKAKKRGEADYDSSMFVEDAQQLP